MEVNELGFTAEKMAELDSKYYLETLEKSLSVLDLVNTYFALVQNFYTWLTDRQHNIHQADLEKLEKM